MKFSRQLKLKVFYVFKLQKCNHTLRKSLSTSLSLHRTAGVIKRTVLCNLNVIWEIHSLFCKLGFCWPASFSEDTTRQEHTNESQLSFLTTAQTTLYPSLTHYVENTVFLHLTDFKVVQILSNYQALFLSFCVCMYVRSQPGVLLLRGYLSCCKIFDCTYKNESLWLV